MRSHLRGRSHRLEKCTSAPPLPPGRKGGSIQGKVSCAVEAAETRQADEPSIATPTHESDERQGTQARTKGKEETWPKEDVVEPPRAKKKAVEREVHGPSTHVRKFRKKRNER